MKKPRIPILRLDYTPEDEDYITAGILEVLRSGYLTMGKKVALFEKQFAEFTGSQFAVATNSGTSSIEIPLRAIGIEARLRDGLDELHCELFSRLLPVPSHAPFSPVLPITPIAPITLPISVSYMRGHSGARLDRLAVKKCRFHRGSRKAVQDGAVDFFLH